MSGRPESPAREVRVVMYVFNDVTLDSRVLREAGTLASNGYSVTVMATTIDRRASRVERESRDGFEIVRVPPPQGWRRTWQWVTNPWSLRRRATGRITSALRGGPSAWATIPPAGAEIVVALVLSTLRRIHLSAASSDGDTGRAVWPPQSAAWFATWRWSIGGWARRAAALAPPAEIHHGHDLTALGAARAGARRDGSILIYDSHEIFVDSGLNATRPRWIRWLLRLREWRWTRGAAALVTVNDAYADVLRRRLRPRRVAVVHNCPPRWSAPRPASDRLRVAADIPADAPIVLYHGAFSRHRGISELAEAIHEEGLERVHLVYLGYGGLRATVDELVADPRAAGRIHVVDAVPPDELLEMVAGADVDVIPLAHSSLNHWLCTPNKLFESLAAGVPVVCSDFPVMRSIVLDGRWGSLGRVCDPSDAASIGAAIRAILDLAPADREALRARCSKASREDWNWERESTRLIELYRDLAPR